MLLLISSPAIKQCIFVHSLVPGLECESRMSATFAKELVALLGRLVAWATLSEIPMPKISAMLSMDLNVDV